MDQTQDLRALHDIATIAGQIREVARQNHRIAEAEAERVQADIEQHTIDLEVRASEAALRPLVVDVADVDSPAGGAADLVAIGDRRAGSRRGS